VRSCDQGVFARKRGVAIFRHEAKILRVIEYPSVVKVYRFFEKNGTAYMVMPFYKRQTLKKVLLAKTTWVQAQWLTKLL
jgi:serine/threonine protein kinase